MNGKTIAFQTVTAENRGTFFVKCVADGQQYDAKKAEKERSAGTWE